MRKVKKFLVLTLAGIFCAGTVISANAAEFDAAWYAAQNPDVVGVYGNSPEALRAHYEMHGKTEGRMANSRDVEVQLRKLFDAEEYAALYPDVKAAYGTDAEAMFQHYIHYGLLEIRRPSEKVSYESAKNLKEVVEKAMTKAGLSAVPGSADFAAIMEGSISNLSGTVAQAVADQVQAEVDKAVKETVEEAEHPSSSSGGGSSSSGCSGGSSGPVITTTVSPNDVSSNEGSKG